MPPKRTLFVSHDTSLFGAQRVLLTILERIDRRICVPHLLVPYDGPLAGIASGMGIPVFTERLLHWIPGSHIGTCRRRLGYLRRFLATLRERCRAVGRRISEERIDLVYTNTVTCVEGALAARRAGKPHVWHVHEHIRGNRDLSPLAPPWVYGRVLDALSDRVIFCSGSLAEDYPRMPGKSYVIPNGIRIAPRRDRVAAKEKLCSELGLGAGTKIVSVVGGLQPAKDLPTFLEAAARVRRGAGNTAFLVVGKGPDEYTEMLKRRIGDLGLESKATLLGWREDIPDILAATDVLAISSERESFGLTAVEAMAAGTPVVATRCGGPEEVLRDGETGFLVPVKDPDSMAESILRLLGDAALADRMGAAGSAACADLFGEDRFLRSVERVIAGASRMDDR